MPVILWTREGIFKYSPPTAICQGLKSPDWLLTVWTYIPELKYLQELCSFSLCICLPKLSPGTCFLVSWCPLMFGWESTPRVGRHPHLCVVGRRTHRQKSQYPAFEEQAAVAGAGRCRGAVPTEGAQLLPSFLLRSFSLLLQWPPPVPEKLGRSCFGRLLCQPCSLCLQNAEIWLIWQHSSEHPEMLSGGQAFWR